MLPETALSLAVFALVSSITPGSNNFMLLASGVNFGFQRSIPHMGGVALGFGFLMICIGLGLGSLISVVPSLHAGLKMVGAAYLLYLAWRIAITRSLGKDINKGRPMTFWEASAFQWVNPKAWTMALTAVAISTVPDSPFFSLFLCLLVFLSLNIPCIMLWTTSGTMLRGFLSHPVRFKYFNIAMGFLLALTVIPMIR